MINDTDLLIRIKGFLKEILPFSYLSEDDLISICKKIKVSVHKSQSLVFEKNEIPKDYFYIIRKGAVLILKPTDSAEALIDKCGEGDIFGIRPLMAKSEYLYSAKCFEDSILYWVPIEAFKVKYVNYPDAINYMVERFAAGSFMRSDSDGMLLNKEKITTSNLIISPQTSKELICIPQGSIVKEAIEKMNLFNISSIVITNANDLPIGILTDKDIRRSLSDGFQPSEAVDSLMSSPVKCIKPNLSVYAIQMEMINSGYHHMCVTEDGTDQTRGLSMITEYDLLYTSASDPIVILKKIKKATKIIDLIDARKKINSLLLEVVKSDGDKNAIVDIIDMLNRSLISQVVEIALDLYNSTHTIKIQEDSFSFFTMGSAARGEQLAMTDQDNGIIITDTQVQDKSNFLELAQIINSALNDIGYEYCPANMMASNPEWCLTVCEIKIKVEKWIRVSDPESLLQTAIFFDFRHEFGNVDLVNDVKEYIGSLLEGDDIFIRFMADQALKNPPPLSFFRKFIIEKDGQHKDAFDIKLRAIAPLSDMARLLALDNCWLVSSNTVARYNKLKEIDEANALLYESASEAYLELLIMRLKFALANNDSGRYVEPSELSQLQRLKLRNLFKPSLALIDMIQRKYKLSYL